MTLATRNLSPRKRQINRLVMITEDETTRSFVFQMAPCDSKFISREEKWRKESESYNRSM